MASNVTATRVLPATTNALRGVPPPPRFRDGEKAVFALTALTPPPASRVPGSPNSGRGEPATVIASASREAEDVPGPGVRAEHRKLREATQQFEAFFVGYLLKEMRKSVGGEGGVLTPSQGEKIFRDMMDDELARTMSKTSQMGLADLLYEQLAPTLNQTTEGSKE